LQNIRLHHGVQNARVNRIIAANETAILQSIPMPDQPRPCVAQLVQKVIAGHLSAPCFRRARANSSTDPSPMAINPRIQPQAGHSRYLVNGRDYGPQLSSWSGPASATGCVDGSPWPVPLVENRSESMGHAQIAAIPPFRTSLSSINLLTRIAMWGRLVTLFLVSGVAAVEMIDAKFERRQPARGVRLSNDCV
jgi:hypothetical protein